MRGPNLTDCQINEIFEKWQDRKSTKVIAIEMGRSYACIYFQLRKRYLVG
jgi:hypothetical protein